MDNINVDKCSKCGSLQVYRIVIETKLVVGMAMNPLNRNAESIRYSELPRLLKFNYCHCCKECVQIQDAVVGIYDDSDDENPPNEYLVTVNEAYVRDAQYLSGLDYDEENEAHWLDYGDGQAEIAIDIFKACCADNAKEQAGTRENIDNGKMNAYLLAKDIN